MAAVVMMFAIVMLVVSLLVVFMMIALMMIALMMIALMMIMVPMLLVTHLTSMVLFSAFGISSSHVGCNFLECSHKLFAFSADLSDSRTRFLGIGKFSFFPHQLFNSPSHFSDLSLAVVLMLVAYLL